MMFLFIPQINFQVLCLIFIYGHTGTSTSKVDEYSTTSDSPIIATNEQADNIIDSAAETQTPSPEHECKYPKYLSSNETWQHARTPDLYYDYNFNNFFLCEWLIESPPSNYNKKILLEFLYLYSDTPWDCSTNISIYDGYGDIDDQDITLCGDEPVPFNFTSSGPVVSIAFGGTSPQMSAEWQYKTVFDALILLVCTSPEYLSSNESWQLAETPDLSYNWDLDNYFQCEWIIESQSSNSNEKIRLEFLYLYSDDALNCSTNILIFDGDSDIDNQEITLCGDEPVPVNFTSSGPVVFIVYSGSSSQMSAQWQYKTIYCDPIDTSIADEYITTSDSPLIATSEQEPSTSINPGQSTNYGLYSTKSSGGASTTDTQSTQQEAHLTTSYKITDSRHSTTNDPFISSAKEMPTTMNEVHHTTTGVQMYSTMAHLHSTIREIQTPTDELSLFTTHIETQSTTNTETPTTIDHLSPVTTANEIHRTANDAHPTSTIEDVATTDTESQTTATDAVTHQQEITTMGEQVPSTTQHIFPPTTDIRDPSPTHKQSTINTLNRTTNGEPSSSTKSTTDNAILQSTKEDESITTVETESHTKTTTTETYTQELTTVTPTPIIVPEPSLIPLDLIIIFGDRAEFNCSIDQHMSVYRYFNWTFDSALIKNANIEPIQPANDTRWSKLVISEVVRVPTIDITCNIFLRQPDGTFDSKSTTTSLVILSEEPTCSCPADSTQYLPKTPVNEIVRIPCGQNQTGNKIARCVPADGTPACKWASEFNETGCVDQNYTKVIEEIKDITEKDNPTSEEAETVLSHLQDLTVNDTYNGGMKEGNIVASVDAIHELAEKRNQNKDQPVSQSEMESALAVVSDLVDEENFGSWDRTNENQVGMGTHTPTKVVETVEAYTSAKLRHLERESIIPEKNIGTHLYAIPQNRQSSSDKDDFVICTKDKLNVPFASEHDRITVPRKLFAGIPDAKLGCHLFKTMHRILPEKGSKLGGNGTVSVWNDKDNYSLVKSLKLFPDIGKNLNPPVALSFAYKPKSEIPDGDFHYEGVCAFWNESIQEWDPTGCWIDHENSTESKVVCVCNHTTDFGFFEKTMEFIRNLISRISNFISILDLSIGIFAYEIFCKFKTIRTGQSFLFENLSIALTLTNAAMVGALQSKINDKTTCVTVVAFMHFFMMAFMFILLAEAVVMKLHNENNEAYISSKEKKKCFYPKECLYFTAAAWCISAAIVGISIAILRTDSYVTYNSFEKVKADKLNSGNGTINCWVKRPGRIWFVYIIPIATIVLINGVLGISIVIKYWNDKNNGTMRYAAYKVIGFTPILGATWLIGLLVHDGSAADTTFASLNTVEGLVVAAAGFLCDQNIRDKIIECKTPTSENHSSNGNDKDDANVSMSAIEISLEDKTKQQKEISKIMKRLSNLHSTLGGDEKNIICNDNEDGDDDSVCEYTLGTVDKSQNEEQSIYTKIETDV